MRPITAQSSANPLSKARGVAAMIALLVLVEQVALSYSLLAPALTSISASFQTTQIGWVITILSLVGALATPLMVKLGDLHGKRKVILWAAVLSAAGSILAAVAPTFEVLLAGRALQALLLPTGALAYSLMRDILPPSLLAMGASLTTTGVGLVTIGSPALAGFLIDSFGWRSVFWFLLGLDAVTILLLFVLVPETSLRLAARLDWLGAGLIGFGVGSILLGVSMGNSWGWTSPSTLGYLLGGAILMALWVFSQFRVRDPLIDMGLLARRPVWTTIVAGGLGFAAVGAPATLMAMMVMTPRDLGHTYGFGSSAMEVALFSVPIGVGTVLSGVVVGLTTRRLGARLPLLVGSVLVAAGAFLAAVWMAEKWQVVAAFTVLALGAGLLFGAIPNLVIAAVPPEFQGISAGMSGVASSLLTTVGVQVSFVILLNNISGTAGGQPVYSGSGFAVSYAFAGVLALLAFAAAVAVPHGRRVKEDSDQRPLEPVGAAAG